METQVATLAALQASADRVAALMAELDDERERRNRLVIALVDQGASRRDVARAGRMSNKSISCIIADYG